jgi:ABC-type sugar transport system substrate-binding protein
MKKKKRFAAAVMAGVFSASMIAGCGSSASSKDAASSSVVPGDRTGSVSTSSNVISSGSAGTNDSNIDIKVVLKTLSSDYWQYVMKGCQQAGKDLGVQVDIVGATSETAYDEQINQIETIMNSGEGDAMIVSPLQANTVATQIASYDKPVIAIDTEVPSDKVLSFVGFDNLDMGKLAGEAGAKAAKEAGWEKVTAIAIAGVQGDPTSEARLEGFIAGIENQGGEYYENETQYGDGVADKAVNCMEGIIQTHPEGVSVIFCNVDDMAMAAARAAQSYDAYKNTIFIGAGGTASGLQSILNGKETMTVTFDGYDVGYKGVQAAVDAVNGKTLESFIASEGTVVGKEDAQKTLDLVNERMNG